MHVCVVCVCVIMSDSLFSFSLFLQFRLAFAYLSTYGGNLSRKERAYITISGFPKATVQVSCTVPCRTRRHFCFPFLFLFFVFYFFAGFTLAGQFLASLYLGYVCCFPRMCLSRCWLAVFADHVARSCKLLSLSLSAGHCLCSCVVPQACMGCLCHVVYALLLRCPSLRLPQM